MCDNINALRIIRNQHQTGFWYFGPKHNNENFVKMWHPYEKPQNPVWAELQWKMPWYTMESSDDGLLFIPASMYTIVFPMSTCLELDYTECELWYTAD